MNCPISEFESPCAKMVCNPSAILAIQKDYLKVLYGPSRATENHYAVLGWKI